MDDLKRNLAPISSEAWAEIDATAADTLKSVLAARRVVDFNGPLGYRHDAVATGRVSKLKKPLFEGVDARSREVLPMVELRADFEISMDELDDLARGAADADIDSVIEAARNIAMAEDRMVFHGYAAAGVSGIMEEAGQVLAEAPDDATAWPQLVAEGLDRMRGVGVHGPYALVVGSDLFTKLQSAVTTAGRRVVDHVQRLLDGPVIPCRSLDGAVLLSTRGGDFELFVGRDFAIGYSSHDADRVRLYIQETLSFRVIGDEAALSLPVKSG